MLQHLFPDTTRINSHTRYNKVNPTMATLITTRLQPFLFLLLGTWSLLFRITAGESADIAHGMFTYRLPRVHVQFICHRDIRSEFSVVDMFDGYYREILPDVSNTSLRHDARTSTMRDIPRNKWYYNSCNISSPQVLLTMETEGWAQYDMDWNGTSSGEPWDDDSFRSFIMEQVTPNGIQQYIEGNVCNSMEIYRAYVEDWANKTVESFEHDEYLDHSLFLLCGGESYIYYDEEGPSSSFMVVGILVGLGMATMVFSELQKLHDRPSRRRDTATNSSSSSSGTSSSTNQRRSRRRNRQRVDYALAPTEVEMV